jgi:hypothetical protein
LRLGITTNFTFSNFWTLIDSNSLLKVTFISSYHAALNAVFCLDVSETSSCRDAITRSLPFAHLVTHFQASNNETTFDFHCRSNERMKKSAVMLIAAGHVHKLSVSFLC